MPTTLEEVKQLLEEVMNAFNDEESSFIIDENAFNEIMEKHKDIVKNHDWEWGGCSFTIKDFFSFSTMVDEGGGFNLIFTS